MASLVSVKEKRRESIDPQFTKQSLVLSVIDVHMNITDGSAIEWTGVNAAAGPWVARHRLARRPLKHPPHSYIVLAIASFICACPLGVVALYFSIQSLGYAHNGDYWRARSTGRNALSCSIASIIIGTFVLIVIVVLAATGTI